MQIMDMNSSTILSKLIQEESVLSCKDIQDECSLSRKSISMIVHSINRDMRRYGAYIKTVPGKGYSIEVLDEEKYNSFNIDFLFGDLRRQHMHLDRNIQAYLLLFELIFRDDFITISELEATLYYSRRLISSSLKKVKSYLSFFGASIISRPHYGIKIECGEWNRRICLLFLEEIATFITFLPMQKQSSSLMKLFGKDKDRWDFLCDAIRGNFKKNKISMSATKMAKVIQYIIFARERDRYYHLLQFDIALAERIRQTPYFDIACDLLDSIGWVIKENDLIAVAILINCWAERRSISELSEAQYEKGLEDYRLFIKRITSMYENVDKCLDSAFRDEFICYLAGLHERVYFGVPADEEASFHIKKQGYVFSEFCLDFAVWFAEYYGVEISEAEALSLYNIFSASFNRANMVNRIQYKAVLVCLHGYSYARNAASCIMQSHIGDFSRIVPMELTEVDSDDMKGYDLLLTDIGGNGDDFFYSLPVPVVKQQFSTHGCSMNLNNFLRETLLNKLSDILPNENYIKSTAFKKKDDVFNYLVEHYVPLNKREAFLENCHRNDSFISNSYGNQIALISTSAYFLKRTELIVLHNCHTFYWNDEKTNVVLFFNRRNLPYEDFQLFNMIIFHLQNLPLYMLKDSSKFSRDDLVSFIVNQIYPL